MYNLHAAQKSLPNIDPAPLRRTNQHTPVRIRPDSVANIATGIHRPRREFAPGSRHPASDQSSVPRAPIL